MKHQRLLTYRTTHITGGFKSHVIFAGRPKKVIQCPPPRDVLLIVSLRESTTDIVVSAITLILKSSPTHKLLERDGHGMKTQNTCRGSTVLPIFTQSSWTTVNKVMMLSWCKTQACDDGYNTKAE